MIWIECCGERMYWSVENKRWQCRHCDATVVPTLKMVERGQEAVRFRDQIWFETQI
jgi:hypothetical protein